jgi:hypothetical protein
MFLELLAPGLVQSGFRPSRPTCGRLVSQVEIVVSTNDLPDGYLYTQGGQEAVMDKTQMQKERGRLQAVLDGYDSDTHPGLVERIANLDRKIAQAHDA